MLPPLIPHRPVTLLGGPQVVTPHLLNRGLTLSGAELSILRLDRLGNPPPSTTGYSNAHQFYEQMRKQMQEVAYAGNKTEVISIKVDMKYMPKRKQQPALIGVCQYSNALCSCCKFIIELTHIHTI